MSQNMKTSRKILSLLVASGLGAIAIASPTVTPSDDGASAAPTLAYKVAKADRPPPGGGPGAADAVCAKLGVGEGFHAQNAADCGMTNLGKLEPTATVCATPPPGSNLLTEEGANRKCEACVPGASEPQKVCSGEREIKANVGGGFSITYLGKSIECNGNAEFFMKADTSLAVQKSAWKNLPMGNGTDGEVEYMSEITASHTGGTASISLGGGCTVDGTVIKAGVKVDIGLSCKIEADKTFGSRAKRAGKTCGEVEDPCATTEEAPSAAKAVAHPCPVPVTDDAGAPVVEDPQPPVTETDAGAPVPVEEMPGMP